MPEQIIYISPHLDDVVLSCGGLIYEQAQRGDRVEIWTVTSGSPKEEELPEFAKLLHMAWGTSADTTAERRLEDLEACRILAVEAIHLDWLDCIYRNKNNGDALILENDDLFDLGLEPEINLIEEIAAYLQKNVPSQALLVIPIGIGDHMDHRLVKAAAQKSALPAYYYADYPYVTDHIKELAILETANWQRVPAVISEEGLAAWQKAIAAYKSQLSTFWQNEDELDLAIANYCAGGGGRLWQRVE